MKVWYLIQTHRNPHQIYRLVQTIKRSSPDARILIAHDSNQSRLDISPLQNLSEVHLIELNFPIARGDFSLLQPYFKAIDWLLKYDPDFDWLVYLSGQDYPTRSLSDVETFLAETPYDGFIRYWNVLSDESPWGKGRGWKRYFCQYYRFPKWTQPILESIVRFTKARKQIKSPRIRSLIPDLQTFFTYGAWIGTPTKSIPFNAKFICYGGFQWHTLSRKCVQFLSESVHKNSKLVHYYKRTVVPDESFVQTVLINSQLFNLCNDDKRYFDTHEQPGGHARTLDIQDYSTLSNGDFHFARKFDITKDSKILDMLDAKIFHQKMTPISDLSPLGKD